MPRRMSCALTMEAVRARTKTVTRRHPDTWKTLKVGDRLTLVEKAMGLPKGARQIILAEVEIIDVNTERLSALTAPEISAEGFDHHLWTVKAWADWWKLEHGFRPDEDPHVRRIEWRYL